MPRMPALTIPMPITFLGCGKLSSAILEGLLQSIYNTAPPKKSSLEGHDYTPTSLTACVRSQSSADALSSKHEHDSIVHVFTNANVEGVQLADVIILGCKPTAYQEMLAQEGMKEALSGQKVLINLMVGVSPKELSQAVYGEGPFSRAEIETQCAIVNCTPNTAAAVGQSLTMVYDDEDPLPAWALEKTMALFGKVGEVKRIPYSLKNLAPIMSTLTASTAAFFALALEGVAKGAVEQGLNEMTAMEIAAASMRGAAELVAAGQTPDDVRKRIATAGGSTAQGLKHLENHHVMEAMAEAMKKASEAASKMSDKQYWKDKGIGAQKSQEQAPQQQSARDQTAQAEEAPDEDSGK